jgi:hypothetical protein
MRFACGGQRARAGSHGKCARKTAWCLRGRCAVADRGAGVVPALFSQVVMTCRLAEPARTGRRGEGGSVLMPLHSPELRCRGLRCRGLRRRGLRCRLLRLGHGTGQFLAADPDSDDPDEQGEQRDPRGNNERTGKADRQGVIVDGRRRGVPGFGNGRPAFAAAAAACAT